MSMFVLATLVVAACSGGVAYAIDSFHDLSRPSDDGRAPWTAAYKYRVKGTPAKGAEKYEMLFGGTEMLATHLDMRGAVEAKGRGRRSVPITITALVGRGRSSSSTDVFRYDSRKDGPDKPFEYPHMVYFGTRVLDRFDAEISGTPVILEKRRESVAVDGPFVVERLVVGGKTRLSRGALSGSIRYKATGTIATGEHAGKPFKAQVRVKIKKAPIGEQ